MQYKLFAESLSLYLAVLVCLLARGAFGCILDFTERNT